MTQKTDQSFKFYYQGEEVSGHEFGSRLRENMAKVLGHPFPPGLPAIPPPPLPRPPLPHELKLVPPIQFFFKPGQERLNLGFRLNLFPLVDGRFN